MMGVLAAVALVAGALAFQWRQHQQERWRRGFDVGQRPVLELAKLKADLEHRMDLLESAQRRVELGKLR